MLKNLFVFYILAIICKESHYSNSEHFCDKDKMYLDAEWTFCSQELMLDVNHKNSLSMCVSIFFTSSGIHAAKKSKSEMLNIKPVLYHVVVEKSPW